MRARQSTQGLKRLGYSGPRQIKTKSHKRVEFTVLFSLTFHFLFKPSGPQGTLEKTPVDSFLFIWGDFQPRRPLIDAVAASAFLRF